MIVSVIIILFCVLIGYLAWFAVMKLCRDLFKDFNRKIWMTLGLGSVFFSLYFLVVYSGSSFMRQWGPELIFVAQKNPLYFIYGGLALFATLSLTIYFVRTVIKYLYLTIGKD